MMKRLLTMTIALISVLGVWAADTVVSTETTWDFSNLNGGEPATTTFNDVTEDANTPGLYYRAGAADARNITSAVHSSTLKWSFAENVSISSKNYVSLSSNTEISLNDELEASSSGSNSNTSMLAFTIGCPGTVYVAYRVNGETEGRTVSLYYKASSGDSYSVVSTELASVSYARTYNMGYAKYDAEEGGTFFFGGTIGTKVYAVKFVPAANNKQFIVDGTTFNSAKSSGTEYSVYGMTMVLGGESESFSRSNNTSITGYSAYIQTNNAPTVDETTGLPTTGTCYIFKPSVSGTLKVAVMFPSGQQTYMANSDKSYNEGYKSSSNEYTIKHYQLTKDDTYYFWGAAKTLRLFGFVYAIPQKITFPGDITGGSVTTQANAIEDEEVIVTVTPSTGYHLASLKYGDMDITKDGDDYKFTMPASAVTITATFEKDKYALTSTATNGTVVMKKDNAEGADITSGTEIEWGTTVYVSATPTSDAYYFTSLKYGDTDLTNGGTFTMPQAATAVAAVYTAKTAPTYTAPTYSALTYTGEAQNLVSAGSTEHGTIKYATSETGDYSTTIPQGTNAGDYTVYYKVEGDATHTDIAATQVENVKINKATISPSVSITGWTAGESANTPSVEGNTGNGAVTYTYKVKDADDGTYSETVPTEAGDYTIKATIAATTNYEGNTATADFTITAATPTYTITGVAEDVHGNKVVAAPTSATAGTPVTLTITTATTPTNYTLKSISATGVTLSGTGNTRTFTMPAANVTVSATWVETSTIDPKTEIEEEANVGDTSAEITNVNIGENTTEVSISGTIGGQPVTSIAEGTFTDANTANVQSIDLSNTQVALSGDVRSSGVLSAIPENTIIYLPQQSNSATGKNVVVTSDGTNFTCANFEMDGGNSTGKSYSVPKAFIATSAKLTREFPEDVAATVCLPYALTQGQANALGKFYLFKSVSGSTVTMEQVTSGGLESNKPYMFMPNSTTGSNGYVEAANVEVSIANSQTSGETGGGAFTFEGVIADKTFTADEISGGIYGFAAEAAHGASSVGQFVKATSGAYVKAFRAYLVCSTELTGENHSASRGIEGGDALPDTLNVVLVNADGSTTNIGKLELIDTDDNTPRYNLSGQRVDKSYKGIVIINGKKVVIK